jgi:transcription elongation GreA/GreB family factor
VSAKEKLILSTVSAWVLGEKFDVTLASKNDALREAKVARQDGDLSENAPYQAAKEKFRTMGRIQRRLTKEMNQLINEGHTLVDPLSWVSDRPAKSIELGMVVELEQNGEINTVLVGGARDHHVPEKGDIVPIPYTSPLGEVLLHRSSGDAFTAELNRVSQKIRIGKVRRPTREELLNIFPVLREEKPE